MGKKWMKGSGRNAEGSEEHGDELLGDRYNIDILKNKKGLPPEI